MKPDSIGTFASANRALFLQPTASGSRGVSSAQI